MGFNISEKYENLIQNIHYVNEGTLKVLLNIETGNVHIISAYASNIGKSKEITHILRKSRERAEKDKYKRKITYNGSLKCAYIFSGIKHHFNEDHVNENGKTLYNMRINYPWQNSTIDNIIEVIQIEK